MGWVDKETRVDVGCDVQEVRIGLTYMNGNKGATYLTKELSTKKVRRYGEGASKGLG